MATTIRLTRMGRKKRPFYRLVVLDSRKRRDGAYLANLGYYNPFSEPAEVELHADDILSWLGKGATLSETARSLLRAEGILYHFSLIKAGLDEAEITSRMDAWRSTSSDRKEKAAAAAVARREAEREDREKREAEALAAAQKAEEEAAAAAAAEAKAAEEAAAAEAAAEESAEDAESADDAEAGADEEGSQ